MLGPTQPNANREGELVSGSSPSVVWCGEAPAQEGSPSPNPAPGEGAACCCQVKELSVPLLLDVMGDRRIEDNAFFLYLLGRHTGEVCEGSQQCKSLDILVVNHCS